MITNIFTSLLISMPGGFEWIMLIALLGIFLGLPIMLVVLIFRNRDLKNKVARLSKENEFLQAQVRASK